MLLIEIKEDEEKFRRLKLLLDHFKFKPLEAEWLPWGIIIGFGQNNELIYYFVDKKESKKINRLFPDGCIIGVNSCYKKLKDLKLFHESSGILRKGFLSD